MPTILILNGGSSSIRFAFYDCTGPLLRTLHGTLDRIGLADAALGWNDPVRNLQGQQPMAATDHQTAAALLLDWLEAQPDFASVVAVGHRVVHGMQHVLPTRVTWQLLDDLRHISPVDPEHLPGEIALMEQIRQRRPGLAQVACFDTAFHSSLPRVARQLPIPRRLDALGVQRFGFHGLSYAFLMEELVRIGDPAATRGRVLLAHLGNGASLAAVQNGLSVDTSMGFTPGAGLMMSTRSGDIDPGLPAFLARSEQMSPTQFQYMVSRESGLLGVSGISPDLRDLLLLEGEDAHAAEAVALFCYQTRKWIGAFAAVLGGLDTLVFSGGIGENAASVRARICAGFGFLGIELDSKRNAAGEGLISTDASRVCVRVIRTDEALMIARTVHRMLAAGELEATTGGQQP